jgi:hypothetical protein
MFLMIGLYMKANNQKRPDGLRNRTPKASVTAKEQEILASRLNAQKQSALYYQKILTCANCDVPRRELFSNDVACHACGLCFKSNSNNQRRPSFSNENASIRRQIWDETTGAESLISLHASKEGHQRSYSLNLPHLISPPSSPSAKIDRRSSNDYALPPSSLPLSFGMHGTSEAMSSLSLNSFGQTRNITLSGIPSFPKIGKSRHSKTYSDLTPYAFSYKTPSARPKIASRHSHSKSEVVMKKMSIASLLS